MKYLFAAYYCLIIFSVSKAVNHYNFKFKLGEVIYREEQDSIIQESKNAKENDYFLKNNSSLTSDQNSNTITMSMSNEFTTAITNPSPPSILSPTEQSSTVSQLSTTVTPGIPIWVFIVAGVGGVLLLIGLAGGTFFGIIYCRRYLQEKAIRDRIRQQREFENNESGV